MRFEHGHHLLAMRLAPRTATVEAAHVRIGVDRAAGFTGEINTLGARLLAVARNGGNERMGVGMQGIVEHRFGRSDFHHLAQIHDHDPIAQQPHHVEIVRDKEVGHAQLASQVVEELQNPGLYGDVEGRGRLVQDEHSRLKGNGTGNVHPGQLATGELVGKAA